MILYNKLSDRLFLNNGNRKKTYKELDITHCMAKSLIDVFMGPDAWQWFTDQRAKFNAKGLKGRKSKPLTVSQQMMVKGSGHRAMIAKMLKQWRSGLSVNEIAENANRSAGYVSYSLGLSKHYRRVSKERRKASMIQNKQRLSGRLSKKWKKESDFRNHLVKIIANLGYEVTKEVKRKEGEHGRVDILIEHKNARFVVECKIIAKPSKMDQALGQAFVSGLALSAEPCACVPSDVFIDSLISMAAGKMGVVIATENTILNEVARYFAKVLP